MGSLPQAGTACSFPPPTPENLLGIGCAITAWLRPQQQHLGSCGLVMGLVMAHGKSGEEWEAGGFAIVPSECGERRDFGPLFVCLVN